MSSPAAITLYDLLGGPGDRPGLPTNLTVPNPWKVRYALNYKGLDHRTKFVDFPDLQGTRERLGVKTIAKLPDGSPHYTVPVLEDESTGKVLGDSFDTAVYLDKNYPDGPPLFPNNSYGIIKAFNDYVSGTLLHSVARLALDKIPLNPETAEGTRAMYAARFGVPKLQDLFLSPTERVESLKTLETNFAKLAAYFETTSGPFMFGGEFPTYADFIVGGHLMFIQCAVEEWDQILTWNGGIWGRLHGALAPWREVKE
ncbi:hypothetical protein F5Y16DRAFT_357863 [Xylariaceae sp. FL0255]|nr:hypothetical protein F5Y16DRAFT_357863 [Xylariaceae sp. FL0255]